MISLKAKEGSDLPYDIQWPSFPTVARFCEGHQLNQPTRYPGQFTRFQMGQFCDMSDMAATDSAPWLVEVS